MAKKIDYGALFTMRKDGRYQKNVKMPDGSTKALYDRDPEALYRKVLAAEKPAPRTFALMAEEWKAYHFARISYKTSEAYTAPLRRLIEQFGHLPYSEIDAAKIQAYITELAKYGYARRTVQMYLDIMRMIGNYAILQGDATANPAQAVSLPNGLHTTKREIPPDEVISIVKRSFDLDFGLFAYFLLYSGLRRGEALAINYEDIDRKNKVITVNKAVTFKGNRPELKTTKTECGNREVILLDVLADRINPKGKGLIFGDNGKLLTKIQFREKWEIYCREAGLATVSEITHKANKHEYTKHIYAPTVTPHQLRHAYATILYDAKIDEKSAQELLGHSSITVTKNIYTHIRQSRKTGTAKTLNKFVNKDIVKPVVKKPGKAANA